MHHLIPFRPCVFLLAFAVGLPIALRAQTQVNKPTPSDTTATRPNGIAPPPLPPAPPPPPPRPRVPQPPAPPRPTPVDAATAALDPKIVAKVRADFEDWKRKGGGLHAPKLTLFGGRPFVMLTAQSGESARAQNLRKAAIVDVCSRLLDTGAFTDAVITVVERPPGRGAALPPRNSPVNRVAFEASVRTAGKSADVKAAVAAAKKDQAAIDRICTDLGIR